MYDETITRDDVCALANSLEKLGEAYGVLAGKTARARFSPDFGFEKASDLTLSAERRKGISEGLKHSALLLREFAGDLQTLSQFQLSVRREAELVRSESVVSEGYCDD